MILVSSPKKPFVLTAKLTARRQAIIEEYEPEIDVLYERVDETAQAVKHFPGQWTEHTSLEFARNLIDIVLRVRVKDEDDIFQHSCDRSDSHVSDSDLQHSPMYILSLQATWIRNSILNALRNTTKLNTRGISVDFVYQNPTVLALGKFIHDFTLTGVSRQLDGAVKGMKNLVDKYIKDFPSHEPADSVPLQGDAVLVTGTTGAIGSNTLAELCKSPDVTRVVVLARKSTTPISIRQRKALEDRGLDPSIVDSSKITLLEGDPGLPGFGLDNSVLLELKSIITCILHIGMWEGGVRCPRADIQLISLGWRVDFNLGLSSFEPNVAGVRNLINFALESKLPTPPRFIFVSTVAVVARESALANPQRSPVF